MNISSAKSPYLLQVERGNRPKATYGNRFRIALEEEAEGQVTETAEEEEATKEVKEENPFSLEETEEEKYVSVYNITDEEADYFLEKYGEKFNDGDLSKRSDEFDETKDVVDPLQAMEEMTGKISVAKPSYTITDEDAEYFREKYGEKYDEDTAAKLYYELADKGIISRNDAFRASGVDEIKPLSSYRSITYIGGGDPYGLGKCLYRNYGFVSDKVYVKDVSRTDKDSPYKPLWESFKKAYRRSSDAWEDVLQENLDFERYIKENRNTEDYVFQQHRDQVIEGLEKTKDVITRIFGEVTL